jgi:hypothetical protein
LQSPGKAAAEFVRELVGSALVDNRPSGFAGALDRTVQNYFGTGIDPRLEGKEAVRFGIERLKGQNEFIQTTSVFGVNEADRRSIESNNERINILEKLQANLEISFKTLEQARRQNELMQEQNTLLRNQTISPPSMPTDPNKNAIGAGRP